VILSPKIGLHKFAELLSALHSKPPTFMNKVRFTFERSKAAAVHNAKILEEFDFDLEKSILSMHPSPISFGSEFKSSRDLEELLQQHPHWPHIKDVLDKGTSFPLLPISEEDRTKDLDYHLGRGNHKSASKLKEMLDPLISEEIQRGFALPLPLDLIHKISKASLAPQGCHKQEGIDEKGNKIPKYRMTHDQSFPGPSGLAVNLRVKKECLPPITYSWVLMRTIHYICSIRSHHPHTKIFLCKVDLDAAYRRCHLSSETACESLSS